jgi:hypothetical protein
MAALDVRVDDPYVDAVRAAFDTQIAKAGARLAAVLEAAFR